MRQSADQLSGRFAGTAFTREQTFAIMDSIASAAIGERFTDYEGAVQSVMAVDTLLNALVREGRVTQGAAAGIRGDIARAYKAVEEPNAYRPADFRAALKSASGAIGRVQ
mgnify:CR=1 FL=1